MSPSLLPGSTRRRPGGPCTGARSPRRGCRGGRCTRADREVGRAAPLGVDAREEPHHPRRDGEHPHAHAGGVLHRAAEARGSASAGGALGGWPGPPTRRAPACAHAGAVVVIRSAADRAAKRVCLIGSDRLPREVGAMLRERSPRDQRLRAARTARGGRRERNACATGTTRKRRARSRARRRVGLRERGADGGVGLHREARAEGGAASGRAERESVHAAPSRTSGGNRRGGGRPRRQTSSKPSTSASKQARRTKRSALGWAAVSRRRRNTPASGAQARSAWKARTRTTPPSVASRAMARARFRRRRPTRGRRRRRLALVARRGGLDGGAGHRVGGGGGREGERSAREGERRRMRVRVTARVHYHRRWRTDRPRASPSPTAHAVRQPVDGHGVSPSRW